MCCSEEWEILVSEYADGELPEADAERVRVHILQCAACAEYFKQICSDADRVRRAFDMPAVCPVGFALRFMKLITPRQKSPRRWFAAAAAVAAAAAILVMLFTGSAGIGSIARMTDRTANPIADGVTVLRDGSAVGTRPGARLRSGDTIETASNRLAYVDLASGDEIAINRGSSVAFRVANVEHRPLIELAEGEIYINARTDTMPLIVATPAGDIEILGTRFAVAYSAAARETTVTVVDGAVQFGNAQGQVVLSGGMQSKAGMMSSPGDPQFVDALEVVAWANPPTDAKIAQVARELSESLRVSVAPAASVFDLGQPVPVVIEAKNISESPVTISTALLLGGEDTAPRRAQYRLSHLMITRVFGSELLQHETNIPAKQLHTLQPGELWRQRVDITVPAPGSACTVSGQGSYSISAAIAAARHLPGAPDDNTVWADATSECAIVRVVCNEPPITGKPVAGLQLELTSPEPACVLGESLRLTVGLAGVTSDTISVSTGGSLRLEVKPVTYGSLHPEGHRDYSEQLGKTIAELGAPQRAVTPVEFLAWLADEHGIDYLAVSLPDDPLDLPMELKLGEALERLAHEWGLAFELGRAAVWFYPPTERASVADIANVLPNIKDAKDGWVTLKGVDRKRCTITIATDTEMFPHPGFYRCVIEYGSRQIKPGEDWLAAWLGRARSRDLLVAVLAPPAPAAADSNGLRAHIEAVRPHEDALQAEVAIENISDAPIRVALAESLILQVEPIIEDLLNAFIYDREDAALDSLLDRVSGFRAEAPVSMIGESWLEPVLHSEAFESSPLRITADARRTTYGEVLEFIVRAHGVTIARHGSRRYITDRLPARDAHTLSPDISGIDTADAVEIHPGERLTFTASIPVPETIGQYRVQLQMLKTGAAGDVDAVWTGDLRSDATVFDLE